MAARQEGRPEVPTRHQGGGHPEDGSRLAIINDLQRTLGCQWFFRCGFLEPLASATRYVDPGPDPRCVNRPLSTAAETSYNVDMEQQGTSQVIEPDVLPRIYVASLSDYNAGRLHGRWIDATRGPRHIYREVQRMLNASRQPIAEEWAIHDYEGFGAVRLSENPLLETVARIGYGIAQRGDAFSAWIAHIGDDPQKTMSDFDATYLGKWHSVEAYARDASQSLEAAEEVIRELCRPYIRFDISQFATDPEVNLIVAEAPDGEVYIFDARI